MCQVPCRIEKHIHKCSQFSCIWKSHTRRICIESLRDRVRGERVWMRRVGCLSQSRISTLLAWLHATMLCDTNWGTFCSSRGGMIRLSWSNAGRAKPKDAGQAPTLQQQLAHLAPDCDVSYQVCCHAGSNLATKIPSAAACPAA